MSILNNKNMKEYQRLRYEYEPKITGIKDGSGAAWFDKTLLQHNTIFNEWFREGNIFMTPLVLPTEEMVLHLRIDKKAKATDFLATPLGRGFIVSDRVRTLLTSFNLPPHKYYKVIFHEEKTNLVTDKGYWWLCYELITGEYGEFNFAKSEFWAELPPLKPYRGKPTFPDVLYVPTYDAYIAAFEANKKGYAAKKMLLTFSFPQFDIWGDRLLSGSNYISTDLVEAFKRNKITGFRALESDCELVFE